jgi:hypothetical protein
LRTSLHREANASVPSVSDALYSAELIAVIKHLQTRFRVPRGAPGVSRVLKGGYSRAGVAAERLLQEGRQLRRAEWEHACDKLGR